MHYLAKKIDDIFTKMGLLKGSKKVILFFLSKPQTRIKNKKTWILKWIIREGFKKKIMENSILVFSFFEKFGFNGENTLFTKSSQKMV